MVRIFLGKPNDKAQQFIRKNNIFGNGTTIKLKSTSLSGKYDFPYQTIIYNNYFQAILEKDASCEEYYICLSGEGCDGNVSTITSDTEKMCITLPIPTVSEMSVAYSKYYTLKISNGISSIRLFDEDEPPENDMMASFNDFEKTGGRLKKLVGADGMYQEYSLNGVTDIDMSHYNAFVGEDGRLDYMFILPNYPYQQYETISGEPFLGLRSISFEKSTIKHLYRNEFCGGGHPHRILSSIRFGECLETIEKFAFGCDEDKHIPLSAPNLRILDFTPCEKSIEIEDAGLFKFDTSNLSVLFTHENVNILSSTASKFSHKFVHTNMGVYVVDDGTMSWKMSEISSLATEKGYTMCSDGIPLEWYSYASVNYCEDYDPSTVIASPNNIIRNSDGKMTSVYDSCWKDMKNGF